MPPAGAAAVTKKTKTGVPRTIDAADAGDDGCGKTAAFEEVA